MSTTVAIYPIVDALVQAEGMPGVGQNRVWSPANPIQKQFLPFFEKLRPEVGKIPEITGCASFDVAVVKEFLRSRGFSIYLNPPGPGGFSVASILDILVDWLRPGDKTVVECVDGNIYQAARLKSGVGFYYSKEHRNPIASLAIRGGDSVYITRLDTVPKDPFEILGLIEGMSVYLHSAQFQDLIFPMVNLDQTVDVSWIARLRTSGSMGMPVWIEQAVQQNRLRMNEIGARAQSAFAAGVMMGTSFDPDLIIDGPFLTWFARTGLQKPLFVAHVTYENFRNPGGLG